MIDGEIGESEWSGASVINQPFLQIEPEFGEASSFRTRVRVAQTPTALYVAFEAFDPEPSRLAAAISRRDGGLHSDDSVTVALDPFGDGRTAYLFRTNALATQEDARVADNGRTVDARWDAAWLSAAARNEGLWTAEFEIPFSILRYAAGSDVAWGVNFVRTTPRRLETSLWSGPGETVWRVSSFGSLRELELPRQETETWDVIPYGLAVFEEDKAPDYEAGIDMRWRPSSRLGSTDFSAIVASENLLPRDGAGAGGVGTGGGIGKETADYSVIRLQQSLPRGSNVGLLAANRSFLGKDAGSVGLDTTLFFTDTLGMTGQLMRVHGPTADGGLAWFLRPAFDSATTHFHIRYQELDTGIREDANAVGFLTDDDRWRLSYGTTRLELAPDLDNDSTSIHVFEMLYSFNPDLFVKLFVQTNSAIDKENIQALWVWRFKPPFGALQMAYQRGTSAQGLRSQQSDSFFTKLSWVF